MIRLNFLICIMQDNKTNFAKFNDSIYLKKKMAEKDYEMSKQRHSQVSLILVIIGSPHSSLVITN